MKYAGILFILLSAGLISGEYSSYVKKRLSECRDFLSFIGHMKIQVGCFLRPANELVEGFNSKSLSAAGFTEALIAGATLCEAYGAAAPRLSLSEEEREVLYGLFSSIGECYLDDGVRLIDAAEKRLDALYRKNKTECRKNARLVTVVSVTAAIGFLILVL